MAQLLLVSDGTSDDTDVSPDGADSEVDGNTDGQDGSDTDGSTTDGDTESQETSGSFHFINTLLVTVDH